MRTAHLFIIIVTMLGLSKTVASSSEPPSSTPQQVFDKMRTSFRADKSKGLHARYQINLGGPSGGVWFIEVDDGKFKMSRGRIANPNVVLITSDKDWVALSDGKLNGTWAFLTGRLEIRGDHRLARKLDEIFP